MAQNPAQTSGKAKAGLLQIPAAATQKQAPPAKKAHKPPAPRLKLLIRRLPPGLTQVEFESTLGTEWKAGSGKVDWLQYKPGKVSKDPAKPSRPSRAYVHVVSSEQIAPLSEHVRQASFHDARNTFHDPVLLGPPTLEFAPYAKTPGSRVRKDARQGTIDQDPDFISFLESLTQPITKSALADGDGDDKKDAVVITPLVQFIKDKKASKAKDGGNSKSSKGRSDKDTKEKVQAKKLLLRPNKEATTVEPSEKKGKGEKSTKESAKGAKQAASAARTGKANASNTPKESTGSERKRERGNAAIANKILQRDLGVSPAGGRRRGKGDLNDTDSPTDSARDASSPAPEKPKKEQNAKANKKSGAANPKDTESAGTQNVESPATNSNPPAKTPKGAKAKSPATPSPTATQAFLKHANPSQGVTEALLEEAFGSFGAVAKVEIDKKKGFGYVDFAEPEGLQKAMAASPVTVAQSQVVVLERKANTGSEKPRKGRNDQQPNAKSKPSAPSDGATAAPATTAAGGGSSRGSRGGRGSRKGPKGGGNNANADKTEKPKEPENK